METLRSSLELGTSYPVDTSSVESDYAKYYPLSQLGDPTTPLVFVIESSSNYYLQFNDSFLYLRLRILNQANQKLDPTDNAAGSFDLFSSLFSGIEIDQNGQLISTTATLYPYRSHLVKLLSSDYGYKASNAQAGLWFPDTLQDNNTASNDGFKKRMALATQSKPFELVGRLSESLFEQDRYFPPGVTTRILLRQSLPQFCLEFGTGKATGLNFEILNAVFYVRRHLVSDYVIAYHHQILNNNEKLQYPVNHFITRAFNLKEGTTSVLSEALFRGRIPSYLIIAFVATESFQGKLSRQCFNLQHFKLSQISAKIDGESRLYESLNFDFGDGNQFLLGYNTLSSALPAGSDHGITLEQYKKGNFVVCLGINPNESVNGLVLEKSGVTQLDLTFSEALKEAVTCIVVGRFQGKIEIDRNYNVTVQ